MIQIFASFGHIYSPINNNQSQTQADEILEKFLKINYSSLKFNNQYPLQLKRIQPIFSEKPISGITQNFQLLSEGQEYTQNNHVNNQKEHEFKHISPQTAFQVEIKYYQSKCEFLAYSKVPRTTKEDKEIGLTQ